MEFLIENISFQSARESVDLGKDRGNTRGSSSVWSEESISEHLPLGVYDSPADSMASAKLNEAGPNYFAYFKHLVLGLYSQHENCMIPFTEIDSEISVGKQSGDGAEGRHNGGMGGKVSYFHGPGEYFSEAVGEGLTDFEKERLLATLNESAEHFNDEANEMLERIIALFQIDSNLSEKEQSLMYLSTVSDGDLGMPLNNRKRKALSPGPNYSGDKPNYDGQVYNNIQALQGKEEICHEDVIKYTSQLSAELVKLEQNLEEYMNVVMSKCRPMTCIEKHRLGKEIRKLPEKAFNRVVEILQPGNFSTKNIPESISVNLEEQDDVKLWRLYYYVELVLKANKL